MGAEHAQSVPLSEAFLLNLAPAPLRSFRTRRSRCQGRSITLDALHEHDRAIALEAYHLLGVLEGRGGMLLPAEEPPLGERLRALGGAGRYAPESPAREVLHDLRGGAASLLVCLLGDHRQMSIDDDRARCLLARDHRKLMRSAVRDLDPSRREHDLSYRPHTTAQLLAAIRAVPPAHERAPSLSIDCRFEGAVSASCVELGSLDRVLYNVINNASLHADTGPVRIWVLPANSRLNADVRFVVANGLAHAQEQTLRSQFGDTLDGLFTGSFSTRGSGAGMRICAQLVAEAYGLRGASQAVGGKYVGVQLVGGTFVSWFHWPALQSPD